MAVSARQTEQTGSTTRAQRGVILGAVFVGIALRWWDLGGPAPTFDEAFTGEYSHLALGSIPSALRANDAHPPLDYLLRHFFGTAGDTFALRVPSAVFATLTLVLVAWWMWRKGWFGVAVVVLTSLSAFQLLYAHQARMYSLAILCGTVMAVAAERWIRAPGPRWRWIMGAALLVGLFDHSGFLLAAGGAGLVPWLRRDREAWWWRLTVVGALGIWAVVWGPAFLDQSRQDHSSWIPYTSASSIGGTLNGLVDVYGVLTIVAVALVAVGGWLLWRQDRALGRVWLCLFGAPLVVACLIGLRSHFLLTRTIAFSAWAAPLALAAVVERARRHSGPALLVAATLLFVTIVPSIRPAISYHEDSAAALAAVQQRARPGDAVAVYPTWLSPLAIWDLGADPHPVVPTALRNRGAFVFVRGDQPFDGRVWTIGPNTYAMSTIGLKRCPGVTGVEGAYLVGCYEVPGFGGG